MAMNTSVSRIFTFKPVVPPDMGALLYNALPSFAWNAKVATVPWVEGMGCDFKWRVFRLWYLLLLL